MDDIKIKFDNDIEQLTTKKEKAFENVFRPRPTSPMFSSANCTWNPQMDMYETPDEIIILCEIAGVEKKNLEVEISSKAVKIKGNRKQLKLMEKATYRLAQIQYGEFERILFLPTLIDSKQVSSSYSNGFLKINCMKQKHDTVRKIPISDS